MFNSKCVIVLLVYIWLYHLQVVTALIIASLHILAINFITECRKKMEQLYTLQYC